MKKFLLDGKEVIGTIITRLWLVAILPPLRLNSPAEAILWSLR